MTGLSKELQFTSSDGLTLYGTLMLPERQLKAAALLVHGITSDRNEWGVFKEAAEFLAARGIASLRFDYRGHGASTLPSTEITLKGIQQDVISAFRQLESSASDVNIFLIGSSFGGGLAYNAACEIKTFTRAFLLAPVFDYALDIRRSAPDWKRDIEVGGLIQYSTLKLSPSIIQEAEQFRTIVGDCELAATIFHGTRDDDVPIESSRLICANHSNFELIEVEGAGHVISVPGDWDMESEQSWLFVKEVLHEIGDRMNVGQ